jgi:immune inhibitor A
VRRTTAGLLSLALASGLGVTLSSQAAFAAPPADTGQGAAAAKSSGPDELPNPAEQKRRALRSEAITQILNGEVAPQQVNGSTVVKLKGAKDSTPAPARPGQKAAQDVQTKDKYVELKREKTDKIFVILAEFGNERHPSYPDQDTSAATPGPVRFDGPLHNEIDEPNRAVDNSTVWQADYSADYYRQLYFGKGNGVESLKTYYEAQSSGRYSVNGEVTDWVKVRYNEARYGRSNGFPCSGNVCSNTWNLIRDAIDTWVANKKAAGATDASIKAELASFDQWDRNDYDGDGNFNEPDGYIDHFQIVHSGGDQADGDPYQGEDAIWSHRWKAFQGNTTGPAGHLDGGTQIGTTGLWVADYTIQPENGGLSVFAHEYAHDLGLPDDYDTSGAGDNPVEQWSLMAQSRLSAKDDQGIGTRPGDIGAWQKLQLGWLDYEVAVKGNNTVINMGPEEYNSNKPQAIVVPLPKKQVVTNNAPPYAGSKSWYSGAGDGLDNSMSRTVAVPAGTTTLGFQAWWNIEDCGPDPCDYAYVEVDDGTGWKAIAGTIANAAEGNGIDGSSKAWKPASFDLSAYAGKSVGLRVRYATDGAARGNPDDTSPSGIFVDAITITNGATTLFSDGAETSPNGWTLNGFASVGATTTTLYDNYYIAGHRSYVSYDKYLKSGPYYFGYLNTKPDYVDHYAYQQGLLISYWDTSQANNNVSEHPGQGLNLYIDARVKTLYRLDGQPWRTRIQMYDAPFSLTKADSFTLHQNSQPNYIRGEDGNPLFDDTKQYFDPELPNHGVKLPAAGVKIRVLSEDGTSMRVRVS